MIDLEAIEARAAAISVGSWFWSGYRDLSDKLTGRYDVTTTFGKDVAEGLNQADAEFIAHARHDIPALVAEVRSLRAAQAAREAAIKASQSDAIQQAKHVGMGGLR